MRPSRGKRRPRREGEPDGNCPVPVGASCSRRGGAGEPGASRPPGPAPSSSRGRRCGGGAPDRRSCPERRRALGGLAVSPAGRSAARAMRTEFRAGEAEHGRPLHLLPGALSALPAFLAPSRRPRGE